VWSAIIMVGASFFIHEIFIFFSNPMDGLFLVRGGYVALSVMAMISSSSPMA